MNDRTNLHQRLLAIMGDLGGLDKDQMAKREAGGYAYHSVDMIVDHVRPLLVKHEVLMVPTVVDHESEVVETRSGAAQMSTHVTLRCRFVAADDPSDAIEIDGIGQGLDSRDKAPGKAVSYALKTVLLALFFARGGLDNEADAHEDGWGQRRRPAQNAVRDSDREPADYVLPYSKNKGTRLGDLSTKQLQWYGSDERKDDETRFMVRAVLTERGEEW